MSEKPTYSGNWNGQYWRIDGPYSHCLDAGWSVQAVDTYLRAIESVHAAGLASAEAALTSLRAELRAAREEMNAIHPYWAHRSMAEYIEGVGDCDTEPTCRERGAQLCITEWCAVCYAKWWMSHTRAKEAGSVTPNSTGAVGKEGESIDDHPINHPMPEWLRRKGGEDAR